MRNVKTNHSRVSLLKCGGAPWCMNTECLTGCGTSSKRDINSFSKNYLYVTSFKGEGRKSQPINECPTQVVVDFRHTITDGFEKI